MNSKIKKNVSKGGLFIVSTPIGNIKDITLRAIKVLSEADVIAAENTRQALKLGKLLNLSFKKLISYNENNSSTKDRSIINLLLQGSNVCIISDAGTPLISDPGYTLTNLAIKNNIKISAIPGPSSLLSSLVVSGLPLNSFYFVGFAPKKKTLRNKLFSKISYMNSTSVWFESPKRIVSLIQDMTEVFGKIQCVLLRELTKLNEEILRGDLCFILSNLKKREKIKGEIVIILQPLDISNKDKISEDVKTQIQGLLKNESLRGVVDKIVAKTGKPRNLIYKYSLLEKNRLNKN